MQPFAYVTPSAPATAIAAHGRPGTAYLAGGTTLIDLMKLHVMTPGRLIDLGPLPMRAITDRGDRVEIGALVTNADMANHPLIARNFPFVAQALLAGASPQIRNLATAAGNVLQRTRCQYFRDLTARCNKRNPGTGCDAVNGYNRMHAIVGGSRHCIASHPSDLCVALTAADATLSIQGPAGQREVPITRFYTLPGDHPEIENVLAPGEMITALSLPKLPWFTRSTYVKIRDRSSYAFALVSAAVALDLDGRNVRAVRIAVGGIGTMPWRATDAENALRGGELTVDRMRAAARTITDGATVSSDNAFKVPLTEHTVVRALIAAGNLP